jgi:hypothetical protein
MDACAPAHAGSELAWATTISLIVAASFGIVRSRHDRARRLGSAGSCAYLADLVRFQITGKANAVSNRLRGLGVGAVDSI